MAPAGAACGQTQDRRRAALAIDFSPCDKGARRFGRRPATDFAMDLPCVCADQPPAAGALATRSPRAAPLPSRCLPQREMIGLKDGAHE
jgi:hypothetical protein